MKRTLHTLSLMASVLALCLLVSTLVSPLQAGMQGEPEEFTAALQTAKREDGAVTVSAEVVTQKETQPQKKAAQPRQTTTYVSPKQAAEIVHTTGDITAPVEQEEIVVLAPGLAYIDREILVFFDPAASTQQRDALIRTVGGEVVGKMAFLNRYTLKLRTESVDEMLSACETLRQSEAVLFASPNVSYEKRTMAIVPDDPWLEKDSQTGKLVSRTQGWSESNPAGSNWWLEAVQAPSAWAYNEKLSSITVGVVDDGFATDHEDLAGKINFPGTLQERQNRSASHGSHVAGIIAANANNKKGITGLCWNADLLCVDFEADPNYGQFWSSDAQVFAGFLANVFGGAKVINFSIGSSNNYFGLNPINMMFYQMGMALDAFLYSYTMSILLGMGYDFVVVQAAGNGDFEGKSVDSALNGCFCAITEENVFSGFPNVQKEDILKRIIVVAAAENLGDKKFRQAPYSNAGDGVDIAAPGTGVFSCVDPAAANGYSYFTGTSMAAPIVTAVSAMVWSANSALTGAQVKAIVCDSKNTSYSVADNTSAGHPLTNTYRMVNAKLAVQAALKTVE